MSAYKAYRGQEIQGAGPIGLVVLTYDALTASLTRTKQAIERGDLAGEAEHTGRAMEALIELSTSLDMDAGGDIAASLASLYNYMMNRLTDGLCSRSTEAVDEVLELAGALSTAWQELARRQERGGVPAKVTGAHASIAQGAGLALAAG
ncbi:MAG: flagellar export chaperone FliS [Mariprofundaceae bacterium]